MTPFARRLAVTTEPLVGGVLLCLLTIGVFWPVVQFDFVHWDDDAYILNNPRVQVGLSTDNVQWAFTTTYFGYYYPLTWLSHMLDCQLFGMWAGGHHATSLLIHLLNVLLLFGAFFRMTGALWRSFLVAALFAIHPQHVESVAWIAERKDVLSTFFCLAAILAYARYARGPSIGRYVVVCVAFVLGLFAKPMIVTLPFILLLLDFWPLARWPSPKKRAAARVVLEKLPLLVLLPLFGIVTYFAQQRLNAVASVDAVPLAQRAANAAISYVGYIVKTFAPVHLAAFYTHPRGGVSYTLAAAAAVALVVMTAAALWFGRQRRYVAVGWLWYIGTLSPVIGLIQVGNQASADRYTYLPLVGVFLLVVWAGADLFEARFARHRAPAIVVAAVIVVAFAVRAHAQVYTWRDSTALFTSMVAVSPDASVAHYNFGKVNDAEGKIVDAVTSYKRAIELDPARADAWTNLGIDLHKLGRKEDALKAFLRADELKPGVAATQFDIGLEREALGHFPEALIADAEALRLDPTIPGLHAVLSRLYLQLGRPKDAITAGVEAVKRSSNDAESSAYLALAYQNDRQFDNAAIVYREAIRLNPSLVICRYNLGILALKTGDDGAAVEQLKALEGLDAKLAQSLQALIAANPKAERR